MYWFVVKLKIKGEIEKEKDMRLGDLDRFEKEVMEK